MAEGIEGPQPGSTKTEKQERPGGPVRQKPIEIGGIFYDPSVPPKLYKTPDGGQEYRGGKVLDNDEAYSMMFWAQKRPEGLREAMEQYLDSAIKTGEFSSFAGATKTPEGKVELDQDSKEKLSAYRMLAREKGYAIGPFKYNEGATTVQAPITKAGPVGTK